MASTDLTTDAVEATSGQRRPASFAVARAAGTAALWLAPRGRGGGAGGAGGRRGPAHRPARGRRGPGGARQAAGRAPAPARRGALARRPDRDDTRVGLGFGGGSARGGGGDR